MITHECGSIMQAIQTALEISRRWGDECADPTCDVWYRGVNGDFDLVPSAYWANVDEWSPFDTFRQLVGNFIETSHYDEWDHYSLARHYGLPTRLLDWTEGIMQALFFAFDGWDGKSVPSIWMIVPHQLNKLTVGEELIFTPPHDAIKSWLPKIESEKTAWGRKKISNRLPIAIYPRRSNPRIHGQQGVFTIHGTGRKSINEILQNRRNSDRIIARINLPGFDRATVKRDLMYLGMRQAVIYPDADHLAMDIKYLYDLEKKPKVKP